MKTLYAGPSGSVAPDQVADFPTTEARALIDGGYAVPVDEDPSVSPGTKAPRKRGGSKAPAADEGADSDGEGGDA
jgi:hypothetical protein